MLACMYMGTWPRFKSHHGRIIRGPNLDVFGLAGDKDSSVDFQGGNFLMLSVWGDDPSVDSSGR